MKELSTERAIEALHTVRAYYASLTAGYPKGKDRRGIGDVMCSEIANSCFMAIKALEQQPNLQPTCNQLATDCISRQAALSLKIIAPIAPVMDGEDVHYEDVIFVRDLEKLPPVEPERKSGKWIYGTDDETGKIDFYAWTCSECYEKYPWKPKFCPNCGAKMEVDNG